MFQKIPSRIPGCFEIVFNRMNDNRGWFTKTFHEEMFRSLSPDFTIAEEYFSLSTRGVFRGLHFQVPPRAIDKLIFCPVGSVKDFVVDIRQGSPSYGEWIGFELNEETPKAIFVPRGTAHGFYSTSDRTIIQCKSSGIFDGPSDKAISYKSFSLAKELNDPVLSEKDLHAPLFNDFQNPFQY
jgi:dTDP-4-dehydrorhamnose 3,5-epimerase